jgi:hypothetical protein
LGVTAERYKSHPPQPSAAAGDTAPVARSLVYEIDLSGLSAPVVVLVIWGAVIVVVGIIAVVLAIIIGVVVVGLGGGRSRCCWRLGGWGRLLATSVVGLSTTRQRSRKEEAQLAVS